MCKKCVSTWQCVWRLIPSVTLKGFPSAEHQWPIRGSGLLSCNGYTERFPALIWALRSNRWCQRFLQKCLSLTAELTADWKRLSLPSARRFLWPLSATFPVFLSTLLISEWSRTSLSGPATLDWINSSPAAVALVRGGFVSRLCRATWTQGEQHNIDSTSKLLVAIMI